MRRARGGTANLALAATSLLLTMGAVEGAARVYVRMQARPEERGAAGTTRYHPVLGWQRVPGTEQRVVRSEYDVTLRFNDKGLRGPDVPYERPAGVRRILLLGDSFTEGYYVDEPQTVRAVLERRLAAAGCGHVQVVNGGMGGYSTDQEYLFYTTEGHRYGAQLTVVFFYYNDLLYNTTANGTSGMPKPVFTPRPDGTLAFPGSLVLPPAPAEDIAELDEPRPRPWRGSMALRLLSKRTADANPSLHRALARLGLVPPVTAEAPRELWPYGPWHRREVGDMWDRTTAILTALRDAVEAHGGRLAVLYVPVRFEVDEAVWELTRQRYRWGWRWDRSAVFNRLGEVCRELQIPLVDPREDLRRADAAGRPTYYMQDMHWNAAGNDVVAGVLEAVARSALGCGP